MNVNEGDCWELHLRGQNIPSLAYWCEDYVVYVKEIVLDDILVPVDR
jgi:hypothetical protein